jgi:hypothetical protein
MIKSGRRCLGSVCAVLLLLACVARRSPDATPTNALPLAPALFDTSAILRATVAQWRIESAKAEEIAKERIRALGGDPHARPDSAILHHVWTAKPSRWLRDLAQARGHPLVESNAPGVPACWVLFYHRLERPKQTDTLGVQVTLNIQLAPPNAARVTLTHLCRLGPRVDTLIEIYTLTLRDDVWHAGSLEITSVRSPHSVTPTPHRGAAAELTVAPVRRDVQGSHHV